MKKLLFIGLLDSSNKTETTIAYKTAKSRPRMQNQDQEQLGLALVITHHYPVGIIHKVRKKVVLKTILNQRA